MIQIRRIIHYREIKFKISTEENWKNKRLFQGVPKSEQGVEGTEGLGSDRPGETLPRRNQTTVRNPRS